MQKILNMDRSSTILKIACDEKVIDKKEYEHLSGIEYDASNLTKIKKAYKPKEKKRIDNKTLSIWTDVYECIWSISYQSIGVSLEEEIFSISFSFA